MIVIKSREPREAVGQSVTVGVILPKSTATSNALQTPSTSTERSQEASR